MPTYEYYCTACGHEFELFQKMTDAPRKRCPRCGRKVVRKIGAGAGVIFKGSGFYGTDYRSPEYKAKQKAETGAGASEAKPDKPAQPEKADGKSAGRDSGTKPAKESA